MPSTPGSSMRECAGCRFRTRSLPPAAWPGASAGKTDLRGSQVRRHGRTTEGFPREGGGEGVQVKQRALGGPVIGGPVISVERLTKRYDGVLAVDAVSFAIEDGATAALLGGNGAGKTTTLAMLLGLILPTSGSITVLGEDMLRHRYRVLPYLNFS